MARMYEMNLMIRLQDRASARMRRIAGDMNAMSRHAQAQNKLQKLRLDSSKRELDIQKKMAAATDLTNRRSEVGERNTAKRAAAEARLFKAQQTAAVRTTALERARWAQLDAAGRRSSQLSASQKAALLGLESAQANLNAETLRQVNARQLVNSEIAREIKLLNQVNAEIAARAPLEAAGLAAAKQHQRGRALAHAGSLGFMGGAVTVGLAGMAAGSFAKFDVQSAKAATQISDTNLGILRSIAQTQAATGELETRLLGLAKQFPATAEEMTDSIYNIYSSMDLGATASERLENGIRVLNEANKAAVGGQIDLATATDTLITVFNDFDPNLSSMHKNMAELFSIVRFMRGGFVELNEGMNKLAPAAKQAQQSLIEVGSAFALVTQQIPSAAQSSTAVARLLDLFGSKEFIAGMERAGESITTIGADGTQKLKPLSEILTHIVNLDPMLQRGGPKLTQLVKELTQFGSATGKGGSKGLIQMQRALTFLITEHQKHLRILSQAKQDTVEYDKSVAILSETADVKWKTAMNNLRVAWINFGQAAMPIMLTLLNAVTKALDAFNGLSGGTRRWIGIMIVAVGVLTTFAGLFGSVFGGAMMILATRRLYQVEKALKAIAIANGEVVATSPGASKGILSIGKSALKAAGWLGLVVIATDTLKGQINDLQNNDFKGNKVQRGLRSWVGQFKDVSQSFSGMFGVDTAVMFDSFMEKFPTLFGTSKPKIKKSMDELSKAQKEADDLFIKGGPSKLDKIIKINEAATESEKKLAAWVKKLQKATTSARQAALKQQEQDIEAAAKNLVSKYKELETANQTAMGNILEGPISGGPILSAFTQINQTLMGVGVKPIKIPVQFLMQDAQKQLENFELWRGGLKKLAKRLPAEMMQELQGAGIEKLPEILSLADAGPEFLKQYVNVWKDTKAAREQATKADMDSTLTLWNSYGKDVAWQIVNGLADSGAEAKLYGEFSKLVTTTFASQLTESMNKAVSQAVDDWVQKNPKPKVTPKATVQDYKEAEEYSWAWLMSDRAKQVAGAIPGGSIMGPPAPVGTRQYPIHRAIPRLSFRAKGGIIGGSGSGDTVPAMLTPGEVVLNRRHIANAAKMLGTSNDPHSVFNMFQGFDRGGVVKRFSRWAFTGPGGLGPAAKQIAQGFTPSGLKQQAVDVIESFRHPMRRLKSGGQMEVPGMKPGTALTRESLAARKAALAAKKEALGMGKGKAGEIYDLLGLKPVTAAEQAALDERIARTSAYEGPANRMPDKALSEASRKRAQARLLERRQAESSTKQSRDVEKYSANLNKAIFAGLASGRGLLEQYEKFIPNRDSLLRSGYIGAADDYGRRFGGHATAASKRIDASLASARTNQAKLAKAAGRKPPTGPMPGESKKAAGPIPGTAGALKHLRDLKKAKAAAGGTAAKKATGPRPKPKATVIEEAKKLERIVGPVSVDQINRMRQGTAEALRRLASEERGGTKGTGPLPKQDLFSEIGRIEAKKMLDKLKATKSPGKAKGYGNGGWVPGQGNSDSVPAWLTPGEYVVDKPTIRGLQSRTGGSGASHTTHETNLNINVADPTEKAIVDALKPILFSLRHS